MSDTPAIDPVVDGFQIDLTQGSEVGCGQELLTDTGHLIELHAEAVRAPVRRSPRDRATFRDVGYLE